MTGRSEPDHSSNRLRTGAELHQWRTRMAISARQLGKLIGVTERSIHRAEKTGILGSKITLVMELFLSRLSGHGVGPGPLDRRDPRHRTDPLGRLGQVRRAVLSVL
jgi:DNA-binding XRE family transcriptional regulator